MGIEHNRPLQIKCSSGNKSDLLAKLSARTMHRARPLRFPRCRVLDQDLEPAWDQSSISRRFYCGRNMLCSFYHAALDPYKQNERQCLFQTAVPQQICAFGGEHGCEFVNDC
ncbi:hypothetical protein AV530_001719 [Patagioenas fasciata monilis]|uniref:Uncharacterized protein n=1 Tax=Patagioenas fasciata monilis TaxID=372326 RepID=A0A1V4KM27_PATFA|nr:hypothetical protein AV530_001719 [Patagioenas fasciata monilis]